VEPWVRVAVLSVGGALGVNARFWLGVWMSRWVSPQFPWATFTINVSGSFAIGFLTVALASWLPHPHVRLLVVVGFLGGYTTFSTFAFESLTLWENGEGTRSLINTIGSVAAGLVAVALGVALARSVVDLGAEHATRPVGPANVPTDRTQPSVEAGEGALGVGGRRDQEELMIPSRASLLRLYVNSSDRWRGKPLYQAVVETARTTGLAGASVFRVELSYGTHGRLNDERSDYESADIPVLIEVIDAPERAEGLLAELGSMVGEGLATVRAVRVFRYAHPGERRGLAEPAPSERSEPMQIEGDAQRVTVYIGSSDTWNGGNLATAIVERCRAMGIAGATVTRGVMGFGKQSLVHKAHFLGLSDDLPERVEVVDRPERVAALLPILDEMVGGGLVVVEDVKVVRYLHDPKTPAEREV
jgi:protein CrcB